MGDFFVCRIAAAITRGLQSLRSNEERLRGAARLGCRLRQRIAVGGVYDTRKRAGVIAQRRQNLPLERRLCWNVDSVSTGGLQLARLLCVLDQPRVVIARTFAYATSRRFLVDE